MARDPQTINVRAKINRPLAFVGAALKLAGDWLLTKAIRVEVVRGA